MSILEEAEAQALLRQASVSASDVRGCQGRLSGFLQRYLPLFYRKEQRRNAKTVVQGMLSGLQRKTAEPIARQAGVQRKPIQFFVGAGKWDDEAVMAELRKHVAETLGDRRAVLVIDPSAFPKKGTESCGVQRQWCGRLGKIDNCQIGVFLAYAAPGGHAPLDRRLYLPAEWATDRVRRRKCHVPKQVVYQETWRIALDLLDRSRHQLPHGWVAADEEFGRSSLFRAQLRQRQELYFLTIPANLLVRDLESPGPRGSRQGCKGGRYKLPFCRADEWAARQRSGRWQKFHVRDGEKGPLEVEAMQVLVQTKQQSRVGPTERLVVIRTLDKDRLVHYGLSNAPGEVPLAELLRVHGERHWIEQMLEEGKGEAGLDQYEVRSWTGWHHHMTLSLLSLWFLQLERRRVAKKKGGGDGAADAGDLLAPAAIFPSLAVADRPHRQ
jgi:SRSO17 transposase